MSRYVPATIAILMSIPFLVLGIPWRLPYPNSTLMLLFNHEVEYATSTQSLVFFTKDIHSFYPASYLFAKVLYLFIPSPVLVEFVSPVVITAILLVMLSLSWLRSLSGIEWYLAWFGLCCLVLLATTGTLTTWWLWFSSVGLWELLVFLCFLRAIRGSSMRNGSVSLTMLVLLVLMLLGDDGVVFLAAGLTLIVSAILIRSERSHYLRWALLSAVLFLSYEAAIGFVGLSYYGSYLLILKQQLLDLLAAPNTFRTGAYLARVAQPVFQLAGTGIATLAMFAIIPLVLLQRSRKQGWRIWSLLLPAMILVVGDIFRLGIIVTQYFTYAGYLYTYALYLAFPVTILAVVHANLGRNPVLGRKGIFGWKRTFFLTVGICVLIIAVFQINPIIQSGRINSSQDSRVDNTYMQAAGIYATNFSLGAPAETTITGPQTLFLNPSNSSSNYLLTTLLHNPVGPPFELTSMTDLYYNDGPLIIVNNLNCAKLGYC